jgi:hypothetical protein
MKLDRIIAVRNHKTVYRDGELCMKVFDETYSKADTGRRNRVAYSTGSRGNGH